MTAREVAAAVSKTAKELDPGFSGTFFKINRKRQA
jgi:hypothetical protein